MTDTPVQKLTGTLLGLAFAGAGIGICLMVWQNPSQARAPLWVVYGAASAFTFAGFWMIAQTFGLKLVADITALVIAWLIAMPGLWMLFDGTGASCTVGGSIGGAAVEGNGPDWLCRGVFGAGGLLVAAAALAFTIAAVRRYRSRAGSNQTG